MTDKVVFTDFDGTYIKGDSYMMSLWFFPGLLQFIKSLPDLLIIVSEYYFNFITRDEAKKRTFELMYGGMEVSRIEKKLKKFTARLHVFPKVKSRIAQFRELGCRIVVVTASPDIYMDHISKHLGFDGCICTQTERENGVLTGRLRRRNCNYEEKVTRIKESPYYKPGSSMIVFGNSKGDEAMFRISSEFYFVDRNGNIRKGKTPW